MADVHGKFGHCTRKLFNLADNYLTFNHGSFGSTPKSVLAAQVKYRDLMESRPDPWFRLDTEEGYKYYWNKARDALAEVIHARPADVALLENASTAINTIVRKQQYSASDNILIFSFAYPMVKNTLQWLQESTNANIITVKIATQYTTEETLISALEASLVANSGKNITLAIIDHIVSVPALILPIKALTKICKAHGVKQVMIDGAHSIGQIPLDMAEIEGMGVDYYTSNTHKWFSSPKGSAFLWAAPAAQAGVVPLVVSSEWLNERHSFSLQFRYTGTRDFTALCSIADACVFRQQFGETEIMQYLNELILWATHFLVDLWKTETYCPDAMVGSMNNIRLPFDDANLGKRVHELLYQRHGMYMIVLPFDNGQCWTRLSAQIYLERSDFEKLGHAVLQIVRELTTETMATTEAAQ